MKKNEFESNLKRLISGSYPAEYSRKFKEELFKKMSEKLESTKGEKEMDIIQKGTTKRSVFHFKPFLGINRLSWKIARAAICLVFVSIIVFFLVNKYNQDNVDLKLIAGNAVFQKGDIKLTDVAQATLRKKGRIIASGPALPTIQISDSLQVVMNLDTVLVWKGRGKGGQYRFSLDEGEIYISLKNSERLKLFVPSGEIEASNAEFNVKNIAIGENGDSEKVSILSYLFTKPAFAEGAGQSEIESIITVKEGEVRIKNAFGSEVVTAGMRTKLVMGKEPFEGHEADINGVTAWKYLRWKFNLGGRTSAGFGSGRAIVTYGNKIFTYANFAIAKARGLKLFAIDAITGKTIWSREIGTRGIGKSSIRDNLLYVCGGKNKDTHFYALDIETGDIRWRLKTGSWASSPSATDTNNVYFGGGDNYFYALNNKTGELVWKVKTNNKWAVNEPLATEDKMVIVWHQDYNIYAYKADSGEILWKYNTDGTQGDLFLAKDTIYASGIKFLYALDKDSGNLKWKKERTYYSSLGTIHDRDNNEIYFSVESNRFVNFDENTGFINKTLQLPDVEKYYRHGEVIGEKIYISGHNTYCILDKNEGTILWKFGVDSWMGDSSTCEDGKIYLVSNEGILYALSEPKEMKEMPIKELIKKAMAYSAKGENNDAIAIYERIISEIEPGNPDVWFNLAMESETIGNNNRARQASYKCLEFLKDDDYRLKIAIDHLCKFTGALWIKKAFSPVVVENNILYATGASSSKGDAALYAMNISTGNIEEEYEIQGGLCGRPSVITDDLILAPIFSTGVHAIDKETHDIKWKIQTGGGVCAASVDGDEAFIGCWSRSKNDENGFICKVDINTGEIIWGQNIEAASQPPLIIGDTVYAGAAGGGVHAFNKSDGAIKWVRKSPPGRITGKIVASDGILYVGGSYKDKAVFAIDADSGEILWKVDVGKGSWHPCIYNDKVYSVTMDNRIYAFDKLTGDIKWEYKDLKSNEFKEMSRAPAVYEKFLYVPAGDTIYVFDAETGEVKSTFTMDGKVILNIFIHNGVIYISSDDGFLTALPLSMMSKNRRGKRWGK